MQRLKQQSRRRYTSQRLCLNASNDAAVPEQGGEIGIVWDPSNRQGRMPGHFTRQYD
jgi:hypothetical protein